jgi:heme/copper-type cytochrome/quinol oxidase subunit 3
MKENMKKKGPRIVGHPYHMVEPSPWPILMSVSILCAAVGAVCYMHREPGGGSLLLYGLGLIGYCMTCWFMDIINESTYRGLHTIKVQRNIALGFKLFIISEVMFFFGFFWAYFYFALDPPVWIDCTWPPKGIPIINPLKFPLLNTMILVTSGVTITVAHLALRLGRRQESLKQIALTLALGVCFTGIQVMEYAKANFFISDGIYGSCFYMLTGFHGLHVIIGSIFIAVCWVRHYLWHFTARRHLGFLCAIWYWHFVDVVWIFLYIFVYCYSAIGTKPSVGILDFSGMEQVIRFLKEFG